MTEVFVIVTLLNIVGIVVCHQVAKSRGLKVVFWTTTGVLFGPFAIPFVLRSKPVAA